MRCDWLRSKSKQIKFDLGILECVEVKQMEAISNVTKNSAETKFSNNLWRPVLVKIIPVFLPVQHFL